MRKVKMKKNNREALITDNPKKALWDSIRHWWTNVNKPSQFTKKDKACSLCEYYNVLHELDCEQCPLDENGQNCNYGGLWRYCHISKPEENLAMLEKLIELYVLKYKESVQCGEWIYYLS